MTDAETVSFLRAQTTEALIGGLDTQAGMYSAPQTFRDGTVLPRESLLEVFADPARYNSVPIITGTNRDEMKLFMGMDPTYSEVWLGVLPRIRDQAVFDNDTSYHSDRWKLGAVDVPADIMTAGGHEQVYAYRFDWDEGGSLLGLVDLSKSLGAAHAMEIPFVFGDFPGIFPIPRLFTSGNESGFCCLNRSRLSGPRVSPLMSSIRPDRSATVMSVNWGLGGSGSPGTASGSRCCRASSCARRSTPTRWCR